jgi:chromosome segregation ATPase
VAAVSAVEIGGTAAALAEAPCPGLSAECSAEWVTAVAAHRVAGAAAALPQAAASAASAAAAISTAAARAAIGNSFGDFDSGNNEFMSIDERLGKVERKVKTVEQAIQILTELVVSHGESIEKSVYNDAELNAKISALIDAQIRSEDRMSVLNEAQIRSEDRMSVLNEAQIRLNEAQARSDDKMSALIAAQSRGDEKLQNINAALERLVQLVDKAHSRINGLEN